MLNADAMPPKLESCHLCPTRSFSRVLKALGMYETGDMLDNVSCVPNTGMPPWL
ncbi:hypothetical protein [Erythrobacter insulae]|uniref:hypothetical protein n=1 Tax=Erythrobacter insulae TaxID=2584124 RepID=UPI00163D66C8|nr:hypothetical protein [Erythrobacter insulae]